MNCPTANISNTNRVNAQGVIAASRKSAILTASRALKRWTIWAAIQCIGFTIEGTALRSVALKPNERERKMKRTILIGLTLLLALTCLSLITNPITTATQTQPLTSKASLIELQSSPIQLSTSACALKSSLPGVFFSAFDCAPCCASANAAYEYCSRTRESRCECLRRAKDSCIETGCTPCQCCEDWYTRGQLFGCWE